MSEILGGGPVGPFIGRFLGGFHHKVARRLTGRQPRLGKDGLWIYLPLEDAIMEAGLQEVFSCAGFSVMSDVAILFRGLLWD